MSIFYVSGINGSDSNGGTSWADAYATVTPILSNPARTHGDHIWLASGESYLRWASSNVQFIYASVDYGDTPSTSDVEDCTYIPSSFARIYTDSNALFFENSARVKFHWIDFDGAGWVVPQLISSYGSYAFSEIWAFDCKFRNGVIGIRKAATYPGFIKTKRCEFTSISGAGIYASQCQVESDDDLFHDISGIGVHLLNSNGGHASYIKKGLFFNFNGTAYDAIRVDGRAAGDTTLVQQCTMDGLVNVGVNNTPTNLSTTTVDSCIITDSKYPTVNSGGTLNYLYCDFYNNDNAAVGTDTGPASTTIAVDPLFVNSPTGNYSLRALSPCLETGNPSIAADANMGSEELGEVPATTPVDSIVDPDRSFILPLWIQTDTENDPESTVTRYALGGTTTGVSLSYNANSKLLILWDADGNYSSVTVSNADMDAGQEYAIIWDLTNLYLINQKQKQICKIANATVNWPEFIIGALNSSGDNGWYGYVSYEHFPLAYDTTKKESLSWWNWYLNSEIPAFSSEGRTSVSEVTEKADAAEVAAKQEITDRGLSPEGDFKGTINAKLTGEIVYLDDLDSKLKTTDGASVELGSVANDEFVELSDTPSAYTDNAGSIIIVNEGETALEFDTGIKTGMNNRLESTLAFDNNPANRNFTISADTPTYTEFVYYTMGIKKSSASKTVQIDDTTGLHFIYIDPTTDALTSSMTPWDFDGGKVFVATIYWRAGGSDYLLGEERHGVIMDWRTHKYLHDTVGCAYESGLAGAFIADNTFTIASGEIHDEDLAIPITAKTTGRIMYRDGVTGSWIFDAASTEFVKIVASQVQYDNAGVLTNAGSAKYMSMYVFATTDVTNPISVIMGQRIDTTIANALENQNIGGLDLADLPSPEMKPLYQVIIKGAGATFSVERTIDLRTITTLSTGNFVAQDHSGLGGLADDDHRQYAHIAGRSGGQTFIGGTLTGNNLILESNALNDGLIALGASFIVDESTGDVLLTSTSGHRKLTINSETDFDSTIVFSEKSVDKWYLGTDTSASDIFQLRNAADAQILAIQQTGLTSLAGQLYVGPTIASPSYTLQSGGTFGVTGVSTFADTVNMQALTATTGEFATSLLVGGTGTPEKTLTVIDSAAPALIYRNTNINLKRYGALELRANTTGAATNVAIGVSFSIDDDGAGAVPMASINGGVIDSTVDHEYGVLYFHTIEDGVFNDSSIQATLNSTGFGIHTLDPQYALDVVGEVYSQTGSGTAKVYFGNTGTFIERTGSDTVFQSDNRHLVLKTIDADNDIIFQGNSVELMVIDAGTGNVSMENSILVGGIGEPNQALTVEDSMSLKEISSANADTAAYGQIWVRDDSPNVLCFTDDAGGDSQVRMIAPRVQTEASNAAPALRPDTYDAYSATALAADITSFTTNLDGTPTNFQRYTVRLLDNGTVRAIAWGTSFEDAGAPLPTTTIKDKLLTVEFIYNSVTSKWGCVAVYEQT